MDSRRSKKSRSIAIEPKTARPTPASARPPLADRTHSDSAVARRRTSQTPPHGQGPVQRTQDGRNPDVRISDVIDRDSQTSISHDPFFRPYQSPHSTRLAAELRIAHGVVNRNEDVCSSLKKRPVPNSSDMLSPWHLACELGHSYADCLTSSPARMQIFLRSISLCWEAAGSESQPLFRRPWTYETACRQHVQARRCPWMA